MAVARKLSRQFAVVINFAVADYPNGGVLIAKWLTAGSRKVDDRKPPVRQRDEGVSEGAAIVGAAMKLGVGHAACGRHVFRRYPPCGTKYTGNAAHDLHQIDTSG